MTIPLFQPKGGFNLRSRIKNAGNSRAFTLTELLVVLITLALLALLALPALGNAKVSSRQLSCLENLRQIEIASRMYVVEYQQYAGSLSTPAGGSANYAYVWPKRLLTYTGGNRGVFACPAAIPIARWDTNLNTSLGGTYNGVYDPYTITRTSWFSYGINDWGIHFQNGAESVTFPQLGLGGDIDGGLYLGPVRDSDVVAPSQMIMLGDSSPPPPSIEPNFCANIEPATVTQPHTACPSNRHNYQTDLVFTDGHAETPLRNDVRNPASSYWRARWNNDNNPHLAYGNWQANPSWVNTLDSSY